MGRLTLWESGECDTEAFGTPSTGGYHAILVRSRVLDDPGKSRSWPTIWSTMSRITPIRDGRLRVSRRFDEASVGLVLSARHELDGLDVKHVSPIRLVYEHPAEHRLSFDTRLEELENLLDLLADDGIEDHQGTIRRRGGEIFGFLGGSPPLFRGCNARPIANDLVVKSRTARRVCGQTRQPSPHRELASPALLLSTTWRARAMLALHRQRPTDESLSSPLELSPPDLIDVWHHRACSPTNNGRRGAARSG